MPGYTDDAAQRLRIQQVLDALPSDETVSATARRDLTLGMAALFDLSGARGARAELTPPGRLMLTNESSDLGRDQEMLLRDGRRSLRRIKAEIAANRLRNE
jgi:hypothetical protein